MRWNRCRDVTLKSLKEFPDFARYLLTAKRIIKPKRVKSPIIDHSSFPRCNPCVRTRNKCNGGRPCQHCQTYNMRCRDVTEEALKSFLTVRDASWNEFRRLQSPTVPAAIVSMLEELVIGQDLQTHARPVSAMEDYALTI